MEHGARTGRRLVLASNNAKKLLELQQLLAGLGVELVTQDSLGIAEASEPHVTFVENALAKARHAAQHSGLPAIADDSGLCAAALQGAPGVLSARYATLFGRAKSDAHNNEVLLEQMAAHADRRVAYVCALVALRRADDPQPLIACARWAGELLREPRGVGGFGYDPLVWMPRWQHSVAELDMSIKNQYSHRAQAVGQLLSQMQEAWGWHSAKT